MFHVEHERKGLCITKMFHVEHSQWNRESAWRELFHVER